MGDATSGSLEKVRKDILQNTEDLVHLFREREKLSLKIAELKSRKNVEIRDRKREEAVIESLGDLNLRQRAIINMIFEFTISCEDHADESSTHCFHGKNLEIRGERAVLEYIASSIVGKPGWEIYASGDIDPVFVLGAVRGGAHLIKGHCDFPDLRLGHDDNQEKYHISILESGVMKVNPMILQLISPYSKVQVD